jgi:hypothetical protein
MIKTTESQNIGVVAALTSLEALTTPPPPSCSFLSRNCLCLGSTIEEYYCLGCSSCCKFDEEAAVFSSHWSITELVFGKVATKRRRGDVG